MNLPVGVAAFVVAGRVVAESRDPAAGRLDLPGLLLGSLGLGAVTLGLIESNQRGWGSPEIVGLLAAGVALLAGFAATEARRPSPCCRCASSATAPSPPPTPSSCWPGSPCSGSCSSTPCTSRPCRAGRRSRRGCGACPAPWPWWSAPPGRPARPLRLPGAGGGRAAAGRGRPVGPAGIEVGTPYAQLWWRLAMLGAGLGLSISPATAAGVAAMPGTQAGVASAVITTSRQVGGALGVAVLGAVAAARYGRATPQRPGRLPLRRARRLPAGRGRPGRRGGGGAVPAPPPGRPGAADPRCRRRPPEPQASPGRPSRCRGRAASAARRPRGPSGSPGSRRGRRPPLVPTWEAFSSPSTSTSRS